MINNNLSKWINKEHQQNSHKFTTSKSSSFIHSNRRMFCVFLFYTVFVSECVCTFFLLSCFQSQFLLWFVLFGFCCACVSYSCVFFLFYFHSVLGCDLIQCLVKIDDAVSVIVIALNNNMEHEKSDLMAGLAVENQHSDMHAFIYVRRKSQRRNES